MQNKITKSQTVYYGLRDEILSGAIDSGKKLTISAIAKKYNVSEIPVREAIQMLAQEGYLLTAPRVGIRVRNADVKDVEDCYVIRASLEALSARLSIKYISNQNIKELYEMIEQSHKYFDNQKFAEYINFDSAFHMYIYRIAQNERLFDMINDLAIYRKRYPYFSDLEQLKRSMDDHTNIVSALANRNEELVEQLMKSHIERPSKKIIEMIQISDAKVRALENKK